MLKMEEFIREMTNGYSFRGDSIKIGAAMLEGEVIPEAEIKVPLSTLNRHGLIAGATGGGKTKSFQVMAEAFSDASIPCLLLDIKGDMSGLGAAGVPNTKIEERYSLLNMNYRPEAFPVEFLTISEKPGVRVKATVSEFGPILLSRILELNDTQSSIVSMIFKYCDDRQLPLLDLKDLVKILQYIGNEGRKELQEEYGNISVSSTGTILRKVIELQQQNADLFFGEKSFEVDDLMRVDDKGRGIINILRVNDIQDKPRLFSTFMLQILSELYSVCPEEGDMDRPKLILFIDEAHLIFKEASKALLSQLETVIKLIRSKGIGIYFCTQNPTDVPPGILGQLGLKVQHSLRAFTAKDRISIKQTAQNYPLSEFYKTEDVITSLGIGEALVTLLNEKGIPTPLAHVMMCTPRSRMGVLDHEEVLQIVKNSKLVSKYNEDVEVESAYEILNEKLKTAAEQSAAAEKRSRPIKAEKTLVEQITSNTVVKSMMRTAGNTIVRSLLGSLGLGGKRSGKKFF